MIRTLSTIFCKPKPTPRPPTSEAEVRRIIGEHLSEREDALRTKEKKFAEALNLAGEITAAAYVALRDAGLPATADHMKARFDEKIASVKGWVQ